MRDRMPFSIQTFAEVRERRLAYVDKTAYIHKLVSAGKCYFLSRPRRFGKSMFLSTLESYFEGRRDLFEGLAIAELEKHWTEYPVFHLDLSPGDYTKLEGLEEIVSPQLASLERKWGADPSEQGISARFWGLIQRACEKSGRKIVVLIDEYDTPLLDTIAKPELHAPMRERVRAFYKVLKAADKYLQFVFITGVSRFSKVSIFSGLNNLKDISLNPEYSAICGVTQEELESVFAPEIEMIVAMGSGECHSPTHKEKREAYLARVKSFYNGYRFTEKPESVYNSYGLVDHFFENGKFASYWFATATTSFLIELIDQQKIDILKLEKKLVFGEELDEFCADYMEAVPILYQTGYLTITDYNAESDTYTLDYPNEEVRSEFSESLLAYYMHVSEDMLSGLGVALKAALKDGNVDGIMGALRGIIGTIPEKLHIEREAYYHSVIHVAFHMTGARCLSEVASGKGILDMVVEYGVYIYVIEFKFGRSARSALGQIKKKNYAAQWVGCGWQVVLVGVEIGKREGNIKKWVVG